MHSTEDVWAARAELVAASLVRAVTAGEGSNPIFAREGRFLILPPKNERLSTEQMHENLSVALASLRWVSEAASWLCLSPATRGFRRAAAYLSRALAYLQANNYRQALKDARLAIAYSTVRTVDQPLPPIASAEAMTEPGLRCGWPPALVMTAKAHQSLGQHLDAAIHALMALHLDPLDALNAQAVLDMSLANLPTGARDTLIHALTHTPCHTAPATLCITSNDTSPWRRDQHAFGQAGKAGHMSSLTMAEQRMTSAYGRQLDALLLWRQARKLQSLPEFKRPKEKYHHYYQWMRQRVYHALGLITAPRDDKPNPMPAITTTTTTTTDPASPLLPEPVMSKLLTMGADDLDLILRYPVAITSQVVELLSVWKHGGEQGLAGHTIEPPDWDEVKLLAGPECTGLPLGWNDSIPSPVDRPLGVDGDKQQALLKGAPALHATGAPCGELVVADVSKGVGSGDVGGGCRVTPASQSCLLMSAAASGDVFKASLALSSRQACELPGGAECVESVIIRRKDLLLKILA